MLFVKINIIFLVYNLFVRSIVTLDVPHVFQYHKTTRYTIRKDWRSSPSNRKSLLIAADELSLEKSPSFSIAPASLVSGTDSKQRQLSPFHSTTTTTIKPYVDTREKPNSITTNVFDDATAPLNPAPMLKPNPFADSQGRKIRFNRKKGPHRLEEGSFCRRSSDRLGGYCILAYQCLHVIREYRIHGTKIDVCTYRKNIPVICCPLAFKNTDEPRISAQKCQEYHKAARDINFGMPRSLSGKLCPSSVPLIVGGKKTKNDEYPHMAALGWSEDNNQYKWGCGGTLISEQYVLTAAHCVTSEEESPVMVRLGAKNLNNPSSEVQDIKILIIILHPKYRSSSYYYDIALLKLTKRVLFSTHVQPACLWQYPDLDMSTGIATGWGRTEFLGKKSEELQKVDLNIIDDRTCKQIYSEERRLPQSISDEQFCAGNLQGGKDTCQGDSGGPLHVELPEFNCVKFVIGVTSFGKFCAAPNAPGVYTKIYSYLDWIEKIVFRT